jgi:hypothetical protein
MFKNMLAALVHRLRVKSPYLVDLPARPLVVPCLFVRLVSTSTKLVSHLHPVTSIDTYFISSTSPRCQGKKCLFPLRLESHHSNSA